MSTTDFTQPIILNSALLLETVTLFVVNIVLPIALVIFVAFVPALIELKKPVTQAQDSSQ